MSTPICKTGVRGLRQETLRRRGTALLVVIFLGSSPVLGAAGTNGADFLNIPVGARPAALGASYTALADDAYAATWNPSGLGFVDATQLSGQHLSYLDTLHHEYFSFAVPLFRSKACMSVNECSTSALGGSVQYLGSGDQDGMDASGNPTGEFSNYYASYNLAYGIAFRNKFSLGLTGKMIRAKLADVSADAYAADLGSMYRVNQNFLLAASLTNLGSTMKFLSESDSLPMAFHLGAAYHAGLDWRFTSEVVVPKDDSVSFHVGGEWQPLDLLSLRAGYRTDTVKELSTVAGLSAGVGLTLWEQELGYAWVPYGDLGDTHYISLLMKFGEADRGKRNLIQYQRIKSHRTAGKDEPGPDYQQLIELLNDNGEHLAQGQNDRGLNP